LYCAGFQKPHMILRTWGWLGLVLGLIVLQPSTSSSQEFAPLHTTLALWDDAVWLDLLDRNNSIGGRNSDLGVLKRWNDEIDRKYLLDLYVLEENPSEEYRWSRQQSGVRWRGGSITKRDLATFAEFKTEVGISDRWDFGARFDMVRLPRVNRGAFRVFAGYKLSESIRLEAKGQIDPEKPGSDIGSAVQWKADRATLRLEFWVLDAMNDLINVTLNAASQPQTKFTEDYQSQPLALRGSADVNLARGLRFEGSGAWLSHSSLYVFDPKDPASGFTNNEDTWYGAALLEWKPQNNWLINVFGTNWSSNSSHLWDDADLAATNDYDLSERTSRLGATTIYRPGDRWEVLLKGERNWRPETRLDPASSDTLVAYDLDTWLAVVGGRYQSKAGFFTDLRLAYQNSDEPLGSGQVPSASTLEALQYRIAIDAGWRFGRAMWFSLGMAQDIGPDQSGDGFGGARGRGVLSW
ncbi:MAG: hypothetical protein ACC655_10595, partial [Rhodothermia bacterium]